MTLAIFGETCCKYIAFKISQFNMLSSIARHVSLAFILKENNDQANEAILGTCNQSHKRYCKGQSSTL